jgi:hypothetical protein
MSVLALPALLLLSAVPYAPPLARGQTDRFVSRGSEHLLVSRRDDSRPVAITRLHRLRGGAGGSSGGTDWRFFVAGGISAALSHGYTTPIDVRRHIGHRANRHFDCHFDRACGAPRPRLRLACRSHPRARTARRW